MKINCVENEIISKEVDISSEMVKQDARKIHFQVKINGEDINKSKDIVTRKLYQLLYFQLDNLMTNNQLIPHLNSVDQRRRSQNKHRRGW